MQRRHAACIVGHHVKRATIAVVELRPMLFLVHASLSLGGRGRGGSPAGRGAAGDDTGGTHHKLGPVHFLAVLRRKRQEVASFPWPAEGTRRRGEPVGVVRVPRPGALLACWGCGGKGHCPYSTT
jgi:hypothetical protein